MNRERLNSNLGRIAEAIRVGKLFFFAGSGISYDSNLPSAAQILQHTAEVILPALPESEITALCSAVQPEIFYEIIIGTTGTRKSLHLWSSLHNVTQRRFGVNCQPNLAHFFIVERASKDGWPIFTTNFDFMFEAAASMLGLPYRIWLPDSATPTSHQIAGGEVAICKLHGSIENSSGQFTPESLWTTMTEISKVNTRWLDYIRQCMMNGHLCFVGYSARDIDLFPYLKAFAISGESRIVFWINKFQGDNSDQASIESNAIRVEHMWPREAFEIAIDQLGIPCKALSSLTALVSVTPTGSSGQLDMLNSLSGELSAKLNLAPSVKQLMFGFLMGRLGNYARARDVLSTLEMSEPQDLTEKQTAELLLACARVSHEVSCYSSFRRYAKRALRLSRSMATEGLDIRIQARCLLSESLRMSIPHETYFATKRNLQVDAVLFFTFLHFLFTAIVNRCSMFLRGKKLSTLSVAPQHEMLEHSIRLGAFIQRVVGSPQAGWSSFWSRILEQYWKRLHRTSYELGYAAGIANTRRFLFRLNPNKEVKSESDNIYKLMTYSTGKELSARNLADLAAKEGRFDDAKVLYREFIMLAKQSGNRLNAIKGLLGIMYMNRLNRLHPLLDEADTELFYSLTDGFEGRLWNNHFHFLKSILERKDATNIR